MGSGSCIARHVVCGTIVHFLQITKIKDFIDSDDNFENGGESFFKSSYVRIDSFSDSSIDMLVQCFVKDPDWNKFIEPTKLIQCAKNSSLKLKKIDGMTFNPILNKWSVTSDKSVNYISEFKKF